MKDTMKRLVALLVASIIAFGLGYWVADLAIDAGKAKEGQTALKNSAKNVVVSVAESARIETEVAKVDSNVASIKAAIVKRGVTLHPKQKSNVPAPVAHADVQPSTAADLVAQGTAGFCPADPDPYLDRGTVWLLNAARQGRGVGAAGSSDEAESAPSTVGIGELIANDLDVVQMYLELAKRHDELVESVEKHLKDEAR